MLPFRGWQQNAVEFLRLCPLVLLVKKGYIRDWKMWKYIFSPLLLDNGKALFVRFPDFARFFTYDKKGTKMAPKYRALVEV